MEQRRTLSFCETVMMLASGSLRRNPFACSVMYCPAAFSHAASSKEDAKRAAALTLISESFDQQSWP